MTDRRAKARGVACLAVAAQALAGCNSVPTIKQVAFSPGGGKVELRFHPPQGDSYLYREETTMGKNTETEIIQTDIASVDGGLVRVDDTVKDIQDSEDTPFEAGQRSDKLKGVKIETTCDEFAIVHRVEGLIGSSEAEAMRKAEHQINAGLQGVVFPTNPIAEGWHWSTDMDWSALLGMIGFDAKLSEPPTVSFVVKGAEEQGFLKMAVIDYKMVVKLSLFSSLFGDLAANAPSGAAPSSPAGQTPSPFTFTISRDGTLRVDMGTGMVVRDDDNMVVSGSITGERREVKAFIKTRMLQMTRAGVTTKLE